MTLLYQCPLCAQALVQHNQSLCCENHHQFDFAKEGYINLLPVQHKKSKQPGDNLPMVQARRAFFATDHYVFLQQAIVELIASYKPNTVLDLGCGEGFYTHAIANKVNAQIYGVDISKSAIKYAAKRYKNVNFSVASIKQAPLKKQSADVLLSVFAPIFSDELHRLCANDGTLLIVSPGPRHLFELKEHIYDDVQVHDATKAPQGFVLHNHTLLETQHTIETNTIEKLIQMTPFAWKFKDSHYEMLHKSASHTVTLSFYLSEFKVA
ncbi:23S rRNA (guanine(745)-N(1))-methyltransferase [Pseudoalteromonas holothuriae]|uniref:23S rRNA (Guanine(745)-N(1))-methyltransferase n=1 Tax=Pseudoalteromonas holothuriae TaxID=2963714 RepID=A0A9W4VR88_9GAMM|nr:MULTISPECIES: 23S rRNA (guanine(745)-N(1))-methyltransferase [unclassified Pseudoalteromonas]CAH9057795.1 23S rRNA (guanine(745)-N(1))-methyltransferase [Pseudoalteromonas sp. CIP111951]CAH9058893.1 23S rRNA (guanine(745)-N(1))-methyltransferase [Pseudoalteromonas sp. CIP111854]